MKNGKYRLKIKRSKWINWVYMADNSEIVDFPFLLFLIVILVMFAAAIYRL